MKTDADSSPNQILTRLRGQHGEALKMDAWSYMLKVYVKSTMSLCLVLTAGRLAAQGTRVSMEGRTGPV